MKKLLSHLGGQLSVVVLSLPITLFSLFMSSCANLEDVSFYTSISGVVYDASTSEPLGGVNVTLASSGNSQLTKNDGTFLFENVDIQQYTIIFQKSGYQDGRREVTTIVGEQTIVDVVLERIEW